MKITRVECLILANEHPIVRIATGEVANGEIAVPKGPGLDIRVPAALVRRPGDMPVGL